jgi:hypothetical protein
VVLKDKTGFIQLQSSANELFNQGPGGVLNNTTDTYFNGLKVNEFDDIRLADDGEGLKAYVSAGMGKRLTSQGRGAKLIMACYLADLNHNFSSPTFDNDLSGDIGVVYWDPFRDAEPPPPPPPQNPPLNWNDFYTVNSLDAFQDQDSVPPKTFAGEGFKILAVKNSEAFAIVDL